MAVAGDRVEYYRVENTQHSKNKWKAASFTITKRGPGYSESQAKRMQERKERALAMLQPPPDSTSSMLLLRRIPRHLLNIGRINAFFEQFGEVTDVRMNRGRHENMAYVSFLNQAMASKAVASKQPVLGSRDISVQWAVLQNAGGGEESRQAFPQMSTDTSKQPGTNAGSKNIQGAPPLGESAGAGQGVPPPPPKEKFKVIDTAALLKKRKAIKTKQDAVKKKLHDQKQALVRKQIDTYKAMLAKMATATGGGTAASNTKALPAHCENHN